MAHAVAVASSESRAIPSRNAIPVRLHRETPVEGQRRLERAKVRVDDWEHALGRGGHHL